MKFTGYVDDAKLTLDGSLLLTLRVKEKGQAIYWLDNLIKDKLLAFDIKYWKNRRSLNANAYFHLICQKLADHKGISMTEQKNMLIQEYGQFDLDENGNVQRIILDDSIEYLKLPWVHLYPTQEVQWLQDGRLYRVYLVRRGSHTLDSKEMHMLISGLVTEANECGIETLTPAEIEHMTSLWKGAAHE